MQNLKKFDERKFKSDDFKDLKGPKMDGINVPNMIKKNIALIF